MEVTSGISGKDPGQRKLFRSSILCIELLNTTLKYGVLHFKKVAGNTFCCILGGNVNAFY